MDYKYIEQLLDRYWACETSLQEESILRSFFAQEDVPAHLMPYKSVFDCQNEMAAEHLSEDFDQRILSLVETKEVEKKPVVKARRVTLSYSIRPFFKAAAVVAIVLSFSLAVQQAMLQNQPDSNSITIDPVTVSHTPETAYENKGDQSIPDSLVKLRDKESAEQQNTSLTNPKF